MPGLKEAAREFLSHRRFAVAGVSRQTQDAANAIYKRMRELEYEVFKSELDGVKPRETAAELGLPPTRVHTLRYRIRDRLRVFFQDIL